jgi:translation initiation factor IF-3
VRLIGESGQQIGIIPVKEALQRARDIGLDLVEVAPDSRPQVCRIMDFGKFKYEQSKKEKQAKKKAHSFQMKEMRYRPKIDEHDYQFKTRHVREFLMSGSKVRAYVMFRGREMTRIEFGRQILERLSEEIRDIAIIDMARPRLRRRPSRRKRTTRKTWKPAGPRKRRQQATRKRSPRNSRVIDPAYR